MKTDNRAWLITCNPRLYDVIGAFARFKKIEWKQNNNINKGDIVYIYVGSPIKCLKYKCRALKVNLDKTTINDSDFVLDGSNYKFCGRYMELLLLEEYDIPELDIKRLREHGLRTIQGPSRITDELKRYIQKIITKYYNVSCLDNSDIQKLRDEKYQKDYANPSNINTEQWQHLLKDPNVFRLSDIKLMKKFYLSDNHAMTCSDLAIHDGCSPSSYTTSIVALAKRVCVATGTEPLIDETGKKRWWRILFWGRYREDRHFEWKMRPELATAISALYPELNVNMAEKLEETELLSDLKQSSLKNMTLGFQHKGIPRKKQVAIYNNGCKVYKRDRQISINALAHAWYKCEVNGLHWTFIRKGSDKNYTEPHHLVPMSYSDMFEVSLDVEENIVSLCSNCHNQLHYGEGAELLLKKLYNEREKELENVGIHIGFSELLKMYGIK